MIIYIFSIVPNYYEYIIIYCDSSNPDEDELLSLAAVTDDKEQDTGTYGITIIH